MDNKPQSLFEAIDQLTRNIAEAFTRAIFGPKEPPFSEEKWRKDNEELRQVRERLEAAARREYW